jgi:hypothetical protein
MHNAPHPGQFIGEIYLKPNGMSESDDRRSAKPTNAPACTPPAS